MAKTAYVGIGSNLGDKVNNCLRAMDLINGIHECSIAARSDLYRTEPVGVKGQNWYINGVVFLSTDLQVLDLLENLLSIETAMGRERKKRWDSRIIDLDILLYGNDIISEKDLTVPHRRMHLRRFVMVPMVQLAPDLIHPVQGKTMSELLEGLPEERQTVLNTEVL